MNKLGVVTAEEEIRILGFRKAEEVTGIVGFVKIVVLVVFVVLVVIAMIIKNVR